MAFRGEANMVLKNHKLYKRVLKNVKSWLSEDDIKLGNLRRLLEGEGLTPKQRYEVGSLLWCRTFSIVFNRLNRIREMTTRSIYKKKGEDKGQLINNWLYYNYQLYTVTYQSILEVTLLMTNEILDLGNPYRQCNFSSIYENRRVKAAGLDGILKMLMQKTKKHREGKNLLVHQGKATPVPSKGKELAMIDISSIAKELQTDEEDIKAYLSEFLALKSREQLFEKMKRESTDIKLLVKQLFDELYPNYMKIHAFYE